MSAAKQVVERWRREGVEMNAAAPLETLRRFEKAWGLALPAALREHFRPHRRQRRLQLLISVVFVSQAAFQPSATAGNLRRIERGLLQFGHFHRYRRHFAQMCIAAYRLATIAVVGQQFGFIAHANLPHFDPSLKLAGQLLDQISKVNAVFRQIINHDPFAAENVLHVDQFHRQIGGGDQVAALEKFVPLLRQDSRLLHGIGRSHPAKNLPLRRIFEFLSRFLSGLAQHHAAFQTPIGARHDLRSACKRIVAAGSHHPQKPHRTVTDHIFGHRDSALANL